MKRQRLHFNGKEVVLQEEELPPPPPGQMRVRTEWTQISIGTETSWMNERAKTGESCGLGYSHVGIVEELGEGVDTVKPGARVLSSGPHASHANVAADASRLVLVPDGLGPDLATLGVLGSVSHHIVERAEPRMLEAAAVVGQGVVGSLILQLIKSCGVRPLIAHDTEPSRLTLAKELGADVAVNALDGDAADQVKRAAGGEGVSLCIEAANTGKAFDLAIAILALRGRFVISSCVLDPVSFHINQDIIGRELTLIGAHQPKVPVDPNPYYPYTQAKNRLATLEGIRDGRLKVDHLVSHRIQPDQAPAVYEKLRQKDRSFVGVLIDWTA